MNNRDKSEKVDKLVENLLEKKKVEADIEKKKIFLMWSGVVFFMLLIVFAWVYNLKLNFAKNFENDNIKKNDFSINDISDIKNNFTKQVNEIKEELNKLDEIVASSSLENNNTSSVSSSSVEIKNN